MTSKSIIDYLDGMTHARAEMANQHSLAQKQLNKNEAILPI
jgi:hypothetical protein